MAAITLNEGRVLRFPAGAIVTLGDGTDTITFTQFEPGTARVQPGGKEILEYHDRGTLQTPVIGDDMPSEAEFTFKPAESAATVKLMAQTQAQAASGPTGLAKLWTLTIKFPYGRGVSTGIQWVLANCWFAKPGEYREGSKFDTIKVTLRSKDTVITETTY